jgi:glutaredoxin
MVCKLFDMKGVKYELVDLEANPKLRQEVIEKSGAMTVPVTVLNDWEDFTVGFNAGKLLAIAAKG